MSDFAKFLIKAFLRKGLTLLAGMLLLHGYITADESNGFVGEYLEPLVGFVILGASSVWTIIYQKYVKDKVTAALKLPEYSTPTDLKAAMGEEIAVK